MSRVILHCDMNNFFASVEGALHPEFEGKPLAVCGDSAERHGIVLAKNYIASGYGIKTTETVWSAKQKCPDLLTVPPHYEEYMRVSMQARELYKDYTDIIEPMGLDECWLDISKQAQTLEKGEEIAQKIRARIKNELNVTVSIGVSFNKVFAKLGSDIRKPDAVTIIPREGYLDIIGKLPASSLIGVGGNTADRLSTYCVESINDLARFSRNMLTKLLGKMGEELWMAANGLDNTPVVPRIAEELDKSIGNGMTAAIDIETPDGVWQLMLELCQELGHRLTVSGKKASTVSIQIKDNQLNVKQWQCPTEPTQSAFNIAKAAFELFTASYKWDKPIRAVTVRVSGFTKADEPSQVGIFDGKKATTKNDKIDKTLESLRGKFGGNIIASGTARKKH